MVFLAKKFSIIGIAGSFGSKSEAKDFCVNIIDPFRTADIPLWVLNSKETENGKELLVIDALKRLVLQVVQINQTMLRCTSPLVLTAFRAPETEQE